MKRFIVVVAVLLALFAGYAVSAYVGLYRLAQAVEARDVAAASERIDFPRLRQSFAAQIVETYLALTGKRLGRFGAIIAGAGMSLAEPIVAEIMSAQRLVDLLQNGEIAVGTPQSAPAGGPLWRGSRTASPWPVARNASLGFGNFTVSLPAGAPERERFGLHFRLTQWRWKLSAVTLPERIRVRLARELEKTIK